MTNKVDLRLFRQPLVDMKLSISIILFFILQISYAQYDTKSLIRNGVHLIQKEKYTDAIVKFNKAIYVKPYLFDPYFYRGFAKYALGDYIGAESDLNKAITINPYHSEVYRIRGITKGKLQDYNRALLDFHQGIKLDTFNVYLYLNRANLNIDMGNYELALIDCNTAISIKPNLLDAYLVRGASYFLLEKYNVALKDFTKAIKLKPNSDLAYIKRGLVYYEQENYEKSIMDYDTAIVMNQEQEISYFYRAIAKAQSKDFEGAMNDYEKVLELNPFNALTYFNKAILNSELGAFDHAIKDYSKVLELRPYHILSLYNRGGIYFNKKEHNKAIIDYTQAIEYFPDFPGAYINRSAAKRKIGDKDGAIEDYNTGMQILKKFEDQKNRGFFNEYADTNKYFNKLISLDSDFEYYSKNKKPSLQDRFVDVGLIPFFKIKLKNKDDKQVSAGDRFNYYLKGLTDFPDSDDFFTFSNDILNSKMNNEVQEIDLSHLSSTIQSFYAGIANQEIQNFNSAKHFFDKTIEHNSSLVSAWFSRACLEMEIDEFLQKFNTSNNIITLNSQTNSSDGFLNESRADLDLAKHDLQMSIKLKPDFSLAHYNLGNLNCISTEFKNAIINYTNAISIDNEFSEAYFNRGLVRIYQQNTIAGCNDLSKAGELGIKDAYFVIKKFCKLDN